MKKMNLRAAGVFGILLVFAHFSAYACTRCVYQGDDNNIITARSMDWKTEISPNLWILPRGEKRTGKVGPNSISWTSKYGSVVTTTWDSCVADGINEEGLVAQLLWLGESKYPEYDPYNSKKGLAISLWAQYMLDNFTTVAEAVAGFKKEDITVVTDFIEGTETYTTLHLAMTDKSGDNAVFEYVDGKLSIHHDRAYNVMTNSPIFEKQLALNEYWQSISGSEFLPGTSKAADRFVRASYYINSLPKKAANTREAVAAVFSVIRNCSAPFGTSAEGQPNISMTRWRTVYDHKNLVFYFETAMTPNTFWVDLNKVDFSTKTPIKKLANDNNQTYAGETSGQFVVAEPFVFGGLKLD